MINMVTFSVEKIMAAILEEFLLENEENFATIEATMLDDDAVLSDIVIDVRPQDNDETKRKFNLFRRIIEVLTTCETTRRRIMIKDNLKYNLRNIEKLFRLPQVCARGQISPLIPAYDYDIGGHSYE